jgi:hypothetical protein
MGNHFIRFMDRALGAQVAASAYLISLHSLIFGLAFLLFAESLSLQKSVLYELSTSGGRPLWGGILTLGCVSFMVGLYRKNRKIAAFGSVLVFAAWLSAAFLYANSNEWFQLALASVQTLTFAYFFAANWVRCLWEYTL